MGYELNILTSSGVFMVSLNTKAEVHKEGFQFSAVQQHLETIGTEEAKTYETAETNCS